MKDASGEHRFDISDLEDRPPSADLAHGDTSTSRAGVLRAFTSGQITVPSLATLARLRTGECAVVDRAPSPAPSESWTAGRQVVVTIGIDRYAAWPHLSNAVNDARGISSAFRRLGFHEAHSLINEEATGVAIHKLVTDQLSRLDVDDSLVIFFAGHGGTTDRVWADGTSLRTGYLIPSDARATQDDVSTWAPLEDWLKAIARLPPNHILVIVDACHSGIALDAHIKWRDVNTWQTDPSDELSRRRSRRIIVSAMDRQLALDGGPIPGHSLFTGCLIQALDGELPRGGRQTATGSELAVHVQRRVREYPSSRQTPDFGAFEHDDRGEMMIPLFPIAIDAGDRTSISDADVNAPLRQRLAVTLRNVVSDRAAIAQLVTAHAPMIAIAEVPSCDAVALWAYVLVELTNRGAFSEMSALLKAVQLRSRRARRIDWSAFTVLLRPSPVPTVASWSQPELELRCDSATADRAGSVLITDGDTLLEAISTLHWRGARPRDPSIEVTSYQLFGRSKPLLHQATPQPSPGPGMASWLAKIRVPHARIRTRRVSVRCVGTDLIKRRYIVPRAGSICASLVWLAFTAFAWRRLSSISPTIVTMAFIVFGLLSGLWTSIGVQLLRMSHGKRSFRSPFVAWELAVLIAAIMTAVVIVVPPYFIVTVTNASLTKLSLQDTTIPPGTARQVWVATLGDWKPPAPLCRCDGNSHGCQCGDPPFRPIIVSTGHPLFGCLEGDCVHITEHAHDGSSPATIIRAPETTVSTMIFEAGAASPAMQVTPDGAKLASVFVKDVAQTQGSVMRLAILPGARSYKIEFAGRGALWCDAAATHIVRFAIKPPASRAGDLRGAANDSIDITIDKTHSTWIGALEEARACATKAVGPATTLKFKVSSDELTCQGSQIEQVVAFEWSSPAPRDLHTGDDGAPRAHRWLKIGDVVSTWSSTASAHLARACVGAPGPLEVAALAPGARLTLPAELAVSEVKVRREQSDPGSAVPVLCKPRDTLRTVKLVGSVPPEKDIPVGAAHVARLDATTGATCATNTSVTDPHGRTCVLGDAALTCRTLYQGDCRLVSGTEISSLDHTEGCDRLTPNNEWSAQQKALAQGLVCRRVYQCG